MGYKPRIKLIIATEDSHSVSEVKAPNVTNAMYDAAWDLVYTIMTNKRRKASLYTKAQKKKAKAAAAKAKAKKPKRKRIPRKPKLALIKGGAGNSDPIGMHSMVEGNRSDEQT